MWGSRESGFTLLEILIAITLLAFITMGVVSVTENALSTKERTTALNENNLQAETAFSRFDWDFSQIYSPLYFSTVMNLNAAANPGGLDANGMPLNQDGTTTDNTSGNPAGLNTQAGTPSGQANPMLQQYYEQLVQRFEQNEHFSSISKEGLPIPRFYSPDKTVFEFFTSSNRRKMENTRQSHFAWVRYALGDSPQDAEPDEGPEPVNAIPKGLKSFIRYYYPDDPYHPKRLNIEDPKVKGSVLLENVESLEFQFWDYNRKKWENSLRTIVNGEGAIRGVRIIISWYDSSGTKRTATRTFRNFWPMVPPQDTNTTVPGRGATAGATAGANSGTTTGTTNAGNVGGVVGGGAFQ